MAAISNNIKSFFLRKSVLMRLIIVNVAIFVAIYLIAFICKILEVESPVRLLELPASWSAALLHIWSFATYMFVHYDIFHILFNMLWLYCFGIIFLDHYSNRSFVVTYLIGGIAGGIFYLFTQLVYPFYSTGLVGSSAAVLSIAAATALRSPNYRINLFLLGMVKIKWVAIVCFVLFLFGVNIGVGMAHLGGALAGAFIALSAKRGWFDKNGVKAYRKKGVILQPLHSRPVVGEMSQSEIDRELDLLLIKVKKSGYDSLTVREKKELEELSRRLK